MKIPVSLSGFNSILSGLGPIGNFCTCGGSSLFISVSPLCIGLSPIFVDCFAFVFPLGCVYFCSHLPHTFGAWVPMLDFFFNLQGFSSFL
jgi:hypothetical protein